MAIVSELPEIKAWSKYIGRQTEIEANAAMMVMPQQPEAVEGKYYWSVNFYESLPTHLNRWQTFMVRLDGKEILVDDVVNAAYWSIDEWRKNEKPMERFRSESAEDGFVLLRKDGYLTYYNGTATLTGTVERFTDETTKELLGDNICFKPTDDSARLIPISAGTAQMPWFCFTDFSMALKLLKLPAHPKKGTCGYKAEAEVVVKDYIANSQESEVFDTAVLVKASPRGPVRSISCE